MPTYIVLLGPTGAGKSTLGKALAAKLGLYSFSSGQALRDLATQNSPLGRKVKQLLAEGKYATTATMNKVTARAITNHHQGLVLDGYPRTLAQAKWLDTQVPPNSIRSLLLDIDEATLTARLLARGRNDDNPALIKQRLTDFHKKAAPLIPYYTNSGRLQKLNASQTPESVLATALTLL